MSDVNTNTNVVIPTPMPQAVLAFIEAVEAAKLPQSFPYHGATRPAGEGGHLAALMLEAVQAAGPEESVTAPEPLWRQRLGCSINVVEFCAAWIW